MSFRRSFLIERVGQATLANGLWVRPPPAMLTIHASVQPAKIGDYDMLQQSATGGRMGRMMRIYTDAVLIVADPRGANGQNTPAADVLLYGQSPGNLPGRYRVCHVSPWTSGMSLDHFRYLAVEEPE